MLVQFGVEESRNGYRGLWSKFLNKIYKNRDISKALIDRGVYDASTNLFPGDLDIKQGDTYTISIGGTLGSTDVVAGQTVRALVDNPGQTVENWAISTGSGTGDMILADEQNVTGEKIFDGTKLSIRGTGTNKTILTSAETGDGAGHIQTFQNKSGIVANLDDINLYGELGQIINDDFTDLTNWTNVGTATFLASAGRLSISGGNNTEANYLRYDAYGNSNLESWTLDLDIYPASASASTYGIGVYLKGGGVIYQYNCAIKIHLDSTDFGKISFIYSGTSAPSGSIKSDSKLTASTDLHKLRIKFIKNKIIASLTNTVSLYENVSEFEFNEFAPFISVTPNSFKFGIIAYGGSHEVDNFIVNCNDLIKCDYLFIGDSITKGNSNNNIYNRFAELIRNNYDVSTQVNAGGGNCIEDLNVNEILSLEAKNLVVLIGINNLNGSDSASTARTKLNTFINGLTNGGYVVGQDLYICLILPYTTALNTAIQTYNGYIITDYASGVIDLYTTSLSGTQLNPKYTIDLIHPNVELHKLISDIFINKLNISSKYKKIGNYYPVLYDSQSKVQISSSKYRGGKALSQLDVINELGNQLKVGISNNVGGGYIFTNVNDGIFISGGAYYENGQYIAASTTATMLALFQGTFYFYYNTGLTVGAAFTPTVRNRIDNTGIHTP